ncbi:MAG: Crp/Fnr family transcriptional regulator [Bacteroidales bacterium]|nr:Crp/Fnr family transcriptional regulator [Bacteroidales bacterium]
MVHIIQEGDIPKLMANIWDLLTESEQSLVMGNLEIRQFKKGNVIYKEDDEPTSLMCLLKGKVKIFKEGIGGRNQIMRLIRPVQYFGYRAYFASEPYVTEAAAFENSTMVFIPMTLIDTLIKENNQLAVFFIKELARDLGESDERTVTLTQKHIRGRLADSLIFLLDKYGTEGDGCTLNIYLAREDLANLSNMTTSNAIRTLSSFCNEGIVAVDGRKIKIIDEMSLRKINLIG